MRLIPAIEIAEGRCLRLQHGEALARRSYAEDPLDVARRFQDCGLQYLHVIDLDGARLGTVRNYRLLEKIATQTDLKIDFAGGIAAEKDLQIAFECGAVQVNVPVDSQRDDLIPREVAEGWVEKYGAMSLILNIDACTRARLPSQPSAEKPGALDMLAEHRDTAFTYLSYGVARGESNAKAAAFDIYSEILERFEKFKLIAAGEVGAVSEIEKLAGLGRLDGVIIGNALYDGRIKLGELSKHFQEATWRKR